MKTAEQIITMQNIKKWSGSSSLFERGQAYYHQGRVHLLEYNPDSRIWNAEVKGTRFYRVEVSPEDRGVDVLCECKAFETAPICKHIIAVLLEIEQEQSTGSIGSSNKVSLKRNYQITNEMIVSLGNPTIHTDYSTFNHRQPLIVEYICKKSARNLLTIELKIGVKRPFVVKDIGKFLQSIQNRTPYFFSNHFSYDPSQHYFLDEDMKVIQILIEMWRQEDFYNKQQNFYRGFYSHQTSMRAMFIPPMMADKLFIQLRERNVTIDDRSGLRLLSPNEETMLPLTIRLNKGVHGDFELDLSTLRSFTYLEPYGWLMQDNTIYPLTPSQMNVIEELIRLSNQTATRVLPVANQQIGDLVSSVLPRLRRIGEIEIAQQVSNEIVSPKLIVKVFIDQKDKGLSTRVEFHYGNIVLEPFLKNHKEEKNLGVILVREMDKESEVINILESIPFELNDSMAYLEEEDDIYEFLYSAVPRLEGKAQIYMDNKVKSLVLPKQETPITRIDIESGGDLLQISFDIEGINREEIKQVLASVMEKKKYYRLPSGAFLSLEDESFKTVNRLLSEWPIPKGQLNQGVLELPLYRGLQIHDMINGSSASPAKLGKKFRRLIQELQNPDTLDFPIPDGLHATLRDYQQFGFSWLKTMARYQIGSILADDMGLGKTLQAIAYLLSENKRSLVVTPASLVYNWKSEFEKFAPEMNVVVAYGSPEERLQLLQDCKADVIITSYPLLRQDIEVYERMNFDSLILDEAQAIKNHLTKTAKAVKQVRAMKRFALSGTPIENSLDELWSIFDVILPGFFPNQRSFRNLAPEKVAALVKPFILRRVKQEVLQELPEKIETVHRSELTKQQKELYLGYLEQIQQETKETLQTEGFEKSRIKILAGLTRLRQLCCDPSLFLENYHGGSGKLEQLLEIIENARENHRRLLVFSQFTSMLHIIREKINFTDLDYFYLDGQTPSKDRVEMAERFNQGERDLFLISLKAGGTGLNLTGADTVILYDLWWNPAVEEQAAGRAHRMGQKNSVHVLRLITQGTIEEKIYEIQQKKKDLIEQVITNGESSLSSLSEKEIREILGIE